MEFENTEIGAKQTLEAARVKLVAFEERIVNDKEGKMIGTKLVLKCEYPGMKDYIELGQVGYIKDGKLKEGGLWLRKDNAGKIPYGSSVASLLRHFKCQRIGELVGRDIDTYTDDNGYLSIKAY